MIVRFAGFVLAFLVLIPLGAAAQTVTVEGGGAGFGEATQTAFGTVSAGVGGGYGGVSVAIPNATWFQPYFAANGFSEVGGVGQAGANFRLGPAEWLARPVFRAGVAWGSDTARATGGGGVYVGRDFGGLFTADVGSSEGITFSVVHIGAYFSF